ncbi:MAG: hypothetical protein RLZZ107_1315 [Bacteroidota bacterium]|jgi:hypothetical protein
MRRRGEEEKEKEKKKEIEKERKKERKYKQLHFKKYSIKKAPQIAGLFYILKINDYSLTTSNLKLCLTPL